MIGKRAVIPAGVRLGRNVRVDEGVHASDFGRTKNVASGGTVGHKPHKARERGAVGTGEEQRCGDAAGAREPPARHRADRDGTAGRLSPSPTDVDGWLGAAVAQPIERHERDSVVSWDLILDGRSRRDIRLTLILEPSVGIVGWVHYAPPLVGQLPQVVPPVPALERRAAVREVRAVGGRTAGPVGGVPAGSVTRRRSV